MLSNNTFLKTKIQRLLGGLIFVEKRLRVHVQCMLKMGRVYTLADILSKIFVKETKVNWGHYLHDLHLYIRKMLINREMVFFLKKMGLFTVFLYTFTINCGTTGARKMPIEYTFCFICSE